MGTPLSQPDKLLDLASQAFDAQDPGAPVTVADELSVTQVAPREGALDVAVITDVTIVFAEAVDPLTVTSTSFRLLDGGGVPVPGQITISPDALQATLDPDVVLAFSELHTIELTTDVTAASGRAAEFFTSNFSTQGEFDNCPEGRKPRPARFRRRRSR